MSAVSSTTTAIEHLVLFSIDSSIPSSQIDSFLAKANSLKALPNVTHLTASPVYNPCSTDAEPFTHIIHARYASKEDLDAYSSHPSHRSVIAEFAPFVSDTVAVDWVVCCEGDQVAVRPGSAARVVLVKVKEEGDKDGILVVLKKVKSGSCREGKSVEVSFGENFSPGRSKGYEIGMLAVFSDVEELDDGLSEFADDLDSQAEMIDGIIVLDFIVPSPPAV